MKVISLIAFSGVSKGTTGTAEKDGELWKVTWDGIHNMRGIPFKRRLLQDWFDSFEFSKYLKVLVE